MVFEEAPGEESEENVKGHQRKGSPCSEEVESVAVLLPVITWNEEHYLVNQGIQLRFPGRLKVLPELALL